MKPYNILIGDCRERLQALPPQSFHTCVTSPPYFGLRDYGMGDQIGQEKTPEQFIEAMVEVFREVRRVLRDDGTLWLNLGDSFYGSWGNYGAQNRGAGTQRSIDTGSLPTPAWDGRENERPATSYKHPILKPKDMMMIPHRVAIALQADGWYVRSDIVWHKPNAMPESVGDRPTKSHEYIFLLTKQDRYFYDSDAIREPHRSLDDLVRRKTLNNKGDHGGVRADLGRSRDEYFHPAGRNKRSVWTVNTKGYKGAHFAVFPPELVEPCVLAGTSAEGCCSACKAPYERIIEVIEGAGHKARLDETNFKCGSGSHKSSIVEQKGWAPTCSCDAPTEPCSVLDPFNGAGTTGLVALRHGRSYTGIELNPSYVDLAKERLEDELLRLEQLRSQLSLF